jgi:hypothetical protein
MAVIDLNGPKRPIGVDHNPHLLPLVLSRNVSIGYLKHRKCGKGFGECLAEALGHAETQTDAREGSRARGGTHAVEVPKSQLNGYKGVCQFRHEKACRVVARFPAPVLVDDTRALFKNGE